MDVTLTRWFDARFPPLSIFYGGRDFLVLVDPLLERIRKQEQHVNLIRVEKIDVSEVSWYFLFGMWFVVNC
jgi:lysosomal acid lipase/cholesteryl ester hydrolase